MPVLQPSKLVTHLVDKIRGYHKNCNLPTAELDLSGGIDSAVMAALLARALGPLNVITIYSSINSSPESLERARTVAKVFDLNFVEVDLRFVYEIMQDTLLKALDALPILAKQATVLREKDPTIDGSLRSTLRAPLGRYLNRLTGGGIRHGTGNEDEDRWLRFYQKGGDGEVDTNPLASLSKGEVYQIAVELGVPREIIEATPTPDLQGVGEAHNDEAELLELTGVDWTYSRVDPDTGEYTKVGSIEAMSRFLDVWHQLPRNIKSLHQQAVKVHPLFSDLETFEAMVESYTKQEFTTRHKMNPNCPTIVVRTALLRLNLITNTLPQI